MTTRRSLTRRELLELGAATGLAAGLRPADAAAQAGKASPGDRPRNIIFMVADGMSLGVPSMAEPFARLVRGKGTAWQALMKDPAAAQGLFETHALGSLVTDSAAASTAWASGSRVLNGALNVLPDGTQLFPIGRLAHDAGRRIGLVTTTTITHATPAGFLAVQADRDDEHLIAPQYLDRVDVLMGGGRQFFEAARREDQRDLLGEFAGRQYAIWNSRREVTGGGRPDRVLGLFADGHLPYTIDCRHQDELWKRVPTLAEMTRAALDILSRPSRGGFLLQVEGGRVDHAAHANDAAALLWDQLAFDDAVGVALDFARKRGDTLVIVTSDHANANPGLSGMGRDYRDSDRCFARLAGAKCSFDVLRGRLRPAAGDSPGLEADRIVEIGRQALGIEFREREARALCDAPRENSYDDLNEQHRKLVGVLGQIVGNHNGVYWTGTTHTQDLVVVSALGPGAARFAGLLRNTDAFEHLTDLLAIRHQNPRMSAARASPYAAAAPLRRRPHWV